MLADSLGMAGSMAWYLPILIFFARILDVSLGTVRTILVIGGHPWISSILGFFEVVIWVLAVGGVLAYLTNPFALMGYAGGFAVGIIVGMLIERRIALGFRMVRAISPGAGANLSERLRELGYRVTRVEGSGRDGPIELAYLILARRQVPKLQQEIATIDPRAFISVSQADRPGNVALGQDMIIGGRMRFPHLGLRK